ncbi:MAG TPA: hypothetical protein VFH72_09705 [Candidatus Baltobacteraceae bacterium]|nr:hypothetical protein [Candidatus Baltobacteraceae bacterium]
MDANEARDHLEMVDRILANAGDRPVRIIPGLLIVWGLAAAIIDAGQQLYMQHIGGEAGMKAADIALLIGMISSIGVSVWLWRNHRYERISIVEQRMARTMGAVWFTVIVSAFAQPVVFAGWGGAAVWSMGGAIMMLMAGFNGDRRGLVGGLILLASVLIANYVTPHAPGYALAAGFIMGYALPGVLYQFKPPHGNA